MRWGIALLLLCACNEVFGLRETVVVGGTPDAPFACPLDKPPQYAAQLRQVVTQECSDYTTVADPGVDLAVATCAAPINDRKVSTGTRDSMLTPVQGIVYDCVALECQYYTPRLSPDGTRLYVRVDGRDDIRPVSTWFDEYHPSGAGWNRVGRLSFANRINDWISNIARDPSGGERVVLLRADVLEEWTYDGVTWTGSHMYPSGSISPPYIRSVMLSPDSLHITVLATDDIVVAPVVLWGRRDNVGQLFGALSPIPELPVPSDYTVYTSADCGRAYFSGLETIFYAQQL